MEDLILDIMKKYGTIIIEKVVVGGLRILAERTDSKVDDKMVDALEKAIGSNESEVINA